MSSDNNIKSMAGKEKKPLSKRWSFVFYNLLAMFIVIILCIVAVIYGINSYTRHGDEMRVPDVKGLTVAAASSKLESENLRYQISDSVYVKTLPAGTVYDQSIPAGTTIKSGRTIQLTINSGTPPQLILPDIADNSSLREATMRLKAQGFKVGPEKYIPGEKDWVYEVHANGKNVAAGSKISVDQMITLVVGDGSLYTDEFGNDFDPDTMGLDDSLELP